MAVDGKVVRGARPAGGKAPHLLAAVTDAGVVLAQRQVADNSNEIPAFGPLLEPLELTATVVTADGLHTQRSILSRLRASAGGPKRPPPSASDSGGSRALFGRRAAALRPP